MPWNKRIVWFATYIAISILLNDNTEEQSKQEVQSSELSNLNSYVKI